MIAADVSPTSSTRVERALVRARQMDPVAAACAAFIIGLVFMAILAPVIAPYDPMRLDIAAANQGPSTSHWFGTDSLGRDVLSRIEYGARLSLIGPALIILIATICGAFLAIWASWVGGVFDDLISRVLDILFAFPGLIFAMLAVAVFGPGLAAPVIALSIAYLPYIARVLRGASLRERHKPYIDACYVAGLPTRRIALGHLLPNLLPLMLVQSALGFGYALASLAALSYLGFGVAAPTPEWGLMVANGQSALLNGHFAESLFAGAFIIMTVIAFNLLGNRLALRFTSGRQ